MTNTYKLNCGTYDNVNPNYPQYNTSMSPSGNFVTKIALANNLDRADITDQIISWSFNDGNKIYDNTNSSLDSCRVSTVPFGEEVLLINCFMGVTLNDKTGNFCMNADTMGDAFFVNTMDSRGSTTMAQRWPTTFSSF